ncbi:MAG TPA: primase C-terminal domain-containing protein [Terriglobia bacterium]|nr:primase C-terminal domain-containing protein [Terriglobia bacterium]
MVSGARNKTLTSFAGSMRRRGMGKKAIVAALLVENNEKCDGPLPKTEVRRIAESVARYEPHPLASVSQPFRPTEGWNGVYFAHLFGGKVRYCDSRGWFLYDGKRWRPLSEGNAEAFAKEVPHRLLAAAATETNDELRRSLLNHARKSDVSRALTGLLTMARFEPEIYTDPEAFDANPWLLNCDTGTVDMKTGGQRPTVCRSSTAGRGSTGFSTTP